MKKNIIKISKPTKSLQGTIFLPGSKSESNRALIIQVLCEKSFFINNLSTAQDTVTLKKIVADLAVEDSSEKIYDVGAAGTTMRFLTALFSITPGTRILTGSERMKDRPIGILVDGLKQLGADISYVEKEGFPPLKINGKPLKGGIVEIDGSVSSQYITALLLIAPTLPEGLILKFTRPLTSKPYVRMTLQMMEDFGISHGWMEEKIVIGHQPYQAPENYFIESDWSSASYWYSMAALAEQVDLELVGLKEKSMQGDAVVAQLYEFFGVRSEFSEGKVRLTRKKVLIKQFGFDFADCPDIAQTLAVTAAAKNIPVYLSGLHTLSIKETDRVTALKNELKKFGVEVEVRNNHTIKINSNLKPGIKNQQLETYHDHRMALSFAPLAFLLDELLIEDPEVVNKSYPGFWEDLKRVGFEVAPLSLPGDSGVAN